jgi:hypothetical protein
MMFSSNTCRFVVCFLSMSLSATAETVRGAQRELEETTPTVELKTAANYVILAKTGITTVPDSAITGSIAVSPIAETAMTGFDFTYDESGTSSQQIGGGGKAFAASYGGDVAEALRIAVEDMQDAYLDAASRTNTDAERKNLGAGILGVFGGPTDPLTPGVYTFSTYVTITDDITFHGSDTDIFIVQIGGYLSVAAGKKVILTGGAKAENIFWQVTGYANLGAGAHMEGIILGKTAVTFTTGSSLNGRVFAQTACALGKATITQH